MTDSRSRVLRIALVEDEDAHAAATRRAFAAAGSPFEITAVRTLREFRELVATWPPDIALLDLNLPDGSAVEMLTLPPEAGAFPVVVMTSYGNEQVAVNAIKAGALDYVVKSAEAFMAMPHIVAGALREWNLLRDRATARDELREYESRFRQMAEAMGETFWLREIETRQILYVNPAFEELWGVSRENLLADPDVYLERIHPEDRQRVGVPGELGLRSGSAAPFSEEFRIVKPDGSVRWIQTRVYPVFDDHRKLIRYAGIAEDVTSQRRAQQELLESEERCRGIARQFHALLDAIPEDITVQTPDLKVIWANRAVAATLGKEHAELIGVPCHLLRFGKSDPCDDCPVAESLRTRAPAIAIKTNGAGRIFESRAIPVSEGEQIVNVINVVRDITEQTALEEQLRQAQKMESIGTLAGGVAHEFNNALSAVIGYGHMTMIKIAPDAPVRPYVQSMLDGADRAAKLADGLLSFSRKQLITRRPVDIVSLVRKSETVINRIVGGDIRFTATLPATALLINADRSQMEQLLTNLASNAHDAMPDGGSFHVAVALVRLEEAFVGACDGGPPGNYAMISATDTGAGMSEATRKRIFDPFYTTKEVGKGTGLGLSIVHGIVKQHGGFIDLQSEPGKGTTFRIYLPTIVSPEKRDEPRIMTT